VQELFPEDLLDARFRLGFEDVVLNKIDIRHKGTQP
jgi:hypothetical protein